MHIKPIQPQSKKLVNQYTPHRSAQRLPAATCQYRTQRCTACQEACDSWQAGCCQIVKEALVCNDLHQEGCCEANLLEQGDRRATRTGAAALVDGLAALQGILNRPTCDT